MSYKDLEVVRMSGAGHLRRVGRMLGGHGKPVFKWWSGKKLVRQRKHGLRRTGDSGV